MTSMFQANFKSQAEFKQAEAHMFQMLQGSPLVPLIGIDKHEQFEDLIKGAIASKLPGRAPTIEILLRDADAIDEGLAKVKEMKEKYGNKINILIGSVLTAEDVDKAFDAGADGLVGGGFSEKVAERALQKGIPYLPGFMTLSEVKKANEMGLKVIKLFPAASPSEKAIMAPLARTGVKHNPDSNVICTTPSEIIHAWEEGMTEVNLQVPDSEAEWNAIMKYMEDNGMVACCTGGLTADNLEEFAYESQIIGGGASFILAKALESEDELPEAVAKQINHANDNWLNFKTGAPQAVYERYVA